MMRFTNRRFISRLCLAFMVLLTFVAPATGEAQQQRLDMLHVGDRLPRFAMLVPSVHRYLRYKIESNRHTILDFWTREVRFESINGQRLLSIVQEWDGAGTDQYVVKQESALEFGTFRPLTHVRRVTRDNKTTLGGYRFTPGSIEGMKELADNSRSDFFIGATEAVYNFELDIELLQTLALHEGYAVSIPFYDPGQEPPARYVFKVTGTDTIEAFDGHRIDCWIVTADYNDSSAVPTRFWFAKRNQVLVREESRLKDGSILVKTLLTDEASMPSTRPSDDSGMAKSKPLFRLFKR